MSVPNTTTFNLENVVDEISTTSSDLVSCFNEANSSGFDPTYEIYPADSQLRFRNYSHIASNNLIFIYPRSRRSSTYPTKTIAKISHDSGKTFSNASANIDIVTTGMYQYPHAYMPIAIGARNNGKYIGMQSTRQTSNPYTATYLSDNAGLSYKNFSGVGIGSPGKSCTYSSDGMQMTNVSFDQSQNRIWTVSRHDGLYGSSVNTYNVYSNYKPPTGICFSDDGLTGVIAGEDNDAFYYTLDGGWTYNRSLEIGYIDPRGSIVKSSADGKYVLGGNQGTGSSDDDTLSVDYGATFNLVPNTESGNTPHVSPSGQFMILLNNADTIHEALRVSTDYGSRWFDAVIDGQSTTRINRIVDNYGAGGGLVLGWSTSTIDKNKIWMSTTYGLTWHFLLDVTPYGDLLERGVAISAMGDQMLFMVTTLSNTNDLYSASPIDPTNWTMIRSTPPDYTTNNHMGVFISAPVID